MKILTLLFLLVLFPVAAWAEKVALVIGNSEYEFVGRLPNPQNDAKDVAEVLEGIGFDVTVGLDLDYRGMRIAIRNFAQKARTADVVFVYYAGHGVEMDNTNFLVPVNAELRSDIDVQLEAIRLDVLIDSVSSSSNGLKVVLVDACRNNPFLSDMAVTSSTRSIGRGLGRVDPTGVLVGYSARGGTLALDGDGRNSPYASALLTRIPEPGLELGKMFRKIRDDVYQSTGGYQEPFVYGSLPGRDIYLVPAALPELTEQAPDTRSPEDNSLQDNAATADKLLREAIALEDDAAKLGILNMLARLYPETDAGRSAGYLADTLTLNSPAAEPVAPKAEPAVPSETAEAPEQVAVAPVVPQETTESVTTETTAEATEAALSLSRTDYAQMQRALNTLGFNVGTEDGIFGPRSRAGLTNFQSGNGKASTGYLTANVVASLRAVPLPRKAEPATTPNANNSAPQIQQAPVSAPAPVAAVSPQRFLRTFYCLRDSEGIWDGRRVKHGQAKCMRLQTVAGDEMKYDWYELKQRFGRALPSGRTEPLSRFVFPANTTAQFQFRGQTFVHAPRARITQ
ncbi:MAG: caspase family protein [Roseobacter sp.]